MDTFLVIRNRNYRLLFSAGALTNLGDGLVLLALPWLATLMTQDAFAIGAVAAANRLPWLFFAIPAGVIVDRADRRTLMARADLLRAVIVAAILGLALSSEVSGAVWILAGLAFLLGSAEVLRDNAAQTILPDLVDSRDLEAANGQLWSIEQLMGQFVGPPLAGLLITAGIAVPFGIDIALLVLAAGLVWMISLQQKVRVQTRFWDDLREGISFMRSDRTLLRLAIVLGVANFIATGALTVQILFAQDVLGLSAAEYGFILSAGAVGAIFGSLSAPRFIAFFGPQLCLFGSIAGWGVGYTAIGLAGHAILMGVALFLVMAAAMLWNVITVSWRQRRIPGALLGRVNSIYRFFGWGSMPLGALAAGGLVSWLESDLGREAALRGTFLLAGVGCAALLIYAMMRLRLD